MLLDVMFDPRKTRRCIFLVYIICLYTRAAISSGGANRSLLLGIRRCNNATAISELELIASAVAGEGQIQLFTNSLRLSRSR